MTTSRNSERKTLLSRFVETIDVPLVLSRASALCLCSRTYPSGYAPLTVLRSMVLLNLKFRSFASRSFACRFQVSFLCSSEGTSYFEMTASSMFNKRNMYAYHTSVR